MKRTPVSRAAQAGFTIIELIVVIVILGILAATALPKFVDLSGDAKAAALKGIAGAAGSAMTLNYSGCVVRNNVPTTAPDNRCVKVADCDDIEAQLQSAVPAEYDIEAGTGSTTNGTTFNCRVIALKGGAEDTSITAATFTGTAAGN